MEPVICCALACRAEIKTNKPIATTVANLKRKFVFLFFVFIMSLLQHPSRILQTREYECQADSGTVVPLCGRITAQPAETGA
jgi:hypothetical protein